MLVVAYLKTWNTLRYYIECISIKSLSDLEHVVNREAIGKRRSDWYEGVSV